MRKAIAIVLAAAALLALAACGTAAAPKAPEEQEEVNIGMPNPWSEAKDAAEAAEGAGVGYFELPNALETSGGRVDFREFHWMKGLAQADGYIGTAQLTARKGLKQNGEDISGDYTDYKETWNQDVGGVTVKCSGNEKGKAMRAMWVTDNFSYCILVRGQGDEAFRDSYGVDADAVAALVSAIG